MFGSCFRTLAVILFIFFVSVIIVFLESVKWAFDIMPIQGQRHLRCHFRKVFLMIVFNFYYTLQLSRPIVFVLLVCFVLFKNFCFV